MNLLNLVLILVFALTEAQEQLLESSSDLEPNWTLNQDSPLLRSRKRISSSTSNPEISLPPVAELIPINDNQSDSDEMTKQDFITDRVKINLQCNPNSMLLSLNFTQPFRGVVSVGKSSHRSARESQECALRGNGSTNYLLQIWHHRCLTRFDNRLGQFTNTLFVRYHPTLETGGDYSNTLLCKFGLANFSVN